MKDDFSSKEFQSNGDGSVFVKSPLRLQEFPRTQSKELFNLQSRNTSGAMTAGATATPIRCRNLGSPDEIRARGRCFLIVGIVFVVIGIALLCVSLATFAYVIGPSIVVVIWGCMCLLISWKRFQLARMVENNETRVPTVTISGNLPTQYTSHPTVSVFQQSTTTSGNNYGFQEQQNSNLYPGQFSNPNVTSTYSTEAPPYSAYNTYSTPTSPPAYSDVVK